MPSFTLRWRSRRAQPPGLTCQELVELVTAYLEGALDPVDEARFEAHIAACEACTMYLEQIRETIQVLGELTADALSPAAVSELGTAFRDWHAPPT